MTATYASTTSIAIVHFILSPPKVKQRTYTNTTPSISKQPILIRYHWHTPTTENHTPRLTLNSLVNYTISYCPTAPTFQTINLFIPPDLTII